MSTDRSDDDDDDDDNEGDGLGDDFLDEKPDEESNCLPLTSEEKMKIIEEQNTVFEKDNYIELPTVPIEIPSKIAQSIPTEIPSQVTQSNSNSSNSKPQTQEEILKSRFGQNRLWNDLCPYCAFPTIRMNLNMVLTGVMTVKKDCYKCCKSFMLDNDSCMFKEYPFKHLI
jgi:hypothetical protein